MSIRTNKMKAVTVLMKQLTTARGKFHEKGRDESFDGELEKLRLVLKKIKDVFMEVKKKEEKLLDTLAEVYDHLRRLNRRKLHEDMHSICESIRDSALMLLPTLVFDDSSQGWRNISLIGRLGAVPSEYLDSRRLSPVTRSIEILFFVSPNFS